MAFQSTVNQKLAFGVEGDFYDDSPRRVAPYSVEEGAVGLSYTIDANDPTKAVLGGNGVLAGIAVDSKSYPISALTPSLEFRAGAIAQICSMGHIVVKCTTAIAVGNAAYYSTTDGTLKADVTGETIEGYVEIPNSKFVFVTGEANEVGVLELNF